MNRKFGPSWSIAASNATARTRTRPDLEGVLERFRVETSGNASLFFGMIDRIAGLVRSSDDPLVTHALTWLDDRGISSGDELARNLSRVRLLAAAERWPEAVAAAHALAATHAAAPVALSLRADVLSWSGRHDEAIAAYDEYLRLVPGDVNVRRQQARVAGWAGSCG